jgi:hypothetical protein
MSFTEVVPVGFTKIDDGRWLLCRADDTRANRVEKKWANQVICILKEDYNITVKPMMLDEHSYKILAIFDNDADEAEFILKTTSNELILKLVSQ